MSVQVSEQVVAPELVQDRFAGFRNRIFSGNRIFRAPLSECKAVLMFGDAILVLLAAFTAFQIWRLTQNSEPGVVTLVTPNWYWFAMLLGGWWILAWLNDLYHIPSSYDRMANAMRVAVVGVINLVVYLAVYFLIPDQFPRAFFLFFLAIVWPAITLWRIIYATVLIQPNFQRRALIVGIDSSARIIAEAITRHDPGCEIIGYVAGDVAENERDVKGVPVTCEWDNLPTFVREHGVSDIVLARPHDLQADQVQTVLKCFEQGARIVPMPELFEGITGRVPVEHIDERGVAFLPIGWDSRGIYLAIKRVMDIVIAGIGLLMLAPVFPFLALIIKLDSSGPVFYRPERLGRGGKPFRLWKFRTMVSNADRIGDPTFTATNDQRITRVGRILRLTHIDELPQFINVIVGAMSVVGPRPERLVPELEESIPYYRTRYAIKPGATGWALVKQGYAEGLEATLLKLQYDLYYIKHQSVSFDILIMYKSVIHMLTARGR